MADYFNADAIIEAMVQDAKQRVQNAVEEACKKGEEDLQNKKEKAVNSYYTGYSPRFYVRSNQLHDSLDPQIKCDVSDDAIHVDVDIFTKPEAMSHYIGDTGIFGAKNPKQSRIPADEGTIFENFIAGIHPNTGVSSDSVDELLTEAVRSVTESIYKDMMAAFGGK